MVRGVAAGLGRRRIAVRVDEARAAGADPADPVGRAADDEGVARDVAGDDRAGSDGREPADVDAGDDDRAGADRAAVREDDRADLPVVGPGEVAGRGDGARVAVVGQDRARADEHAVLDRHAVVDERRVLDLDPVADR